MPRKDRGRQMLLTGSHPVDNDNGAAHREGQDGASTNDGFEKAVLPGAIFHHPTQSKISVNASIIKIGYESLKTAFGAIVQWQVDSVGA
jgi:hypothetical protein